MLLTMNFKKVLAYSKPMEIKLTPTHYNCELCSWVPLWPTEIFIVDSEKRQSQLQIPAAGDISVTEGFTETALP